MTDPVVKAGVLIILLILLTFVWTYPLYRAEIKRDIRFLSFKAFVHITTALVLFGLAVANWNLDASHVLNMICGVFLLHEGVVTILNMYEDMKRLPIREKGM
ncbi:hypothetical protein [Methanospirillum lacunae]|uniref:Uncharacterized protein n=1 Tax=Methanospirillum lacunae TaxID=668570 RepID=A0A2V2MZT9_9EURY|nr:hypothetical protein [Methanospirillum lacunae]PWR69818.1 hypothetical protein DK846_16715 [Methanospirillum lacunae]